MANYLDTFKISSAALLQNTPNHRLSINNQTLDVRGSPPKCCFCQFCLTIKHVMMPRCCKRIHSILTPVLIWLRSGWGASPVHNTTKPDFFARDRPRQTAALLIWLCQWWHFLNFHCPKRPVLCTIPDTIPVTLPPSNHHHIIHSLTSNNWWQCTASRALRATKLITISKLCISTKFNLCPYSRAMVIYQTSSLPRISVTYPNPSVLMTVLVTVWCWGGNLDFPCISWTWTCQCPSERIEKD